MYALIKYAFLISLVVGVFLTTHDRTRRFLTDKAYATQVMQAWFDRVSDDWCATAEAVAEGALTWSYYDRKRSLFAVRHMAAFRARARWTRIHTWLFFRADWAVMRLGLTAQPEFLQRSR